MKKLLVVAFSIFAAFAWTSSESLGEMFPDTTNNIHLGLAFDYGLPKNDLIPLAGKIDYIWGATQCMGPAIPSMHWYMPFDRDAKHDLAWLQANHPDWIVYQPDRKTIAYARSPHAVPLDITNPDVVAYQMQEVAEFFSRPVADLTNPTGIAFDNLTFRNDWHRAGHFDQRGNWMPLFSGTGVAQDPLYERSVATWLRNVREYFNQHFPGKSIAINFTYTPVVTHAPQNTLMECADLIVWECGFSWHGSKTTVQPFITDSVWQERVQWLENLNRHSKPFFIINEVKATGHDAITPAQVQWVLANYLLVKGTHSYVSIYPYDPDADKQFYGGFNDRPEYRAAIGHPVSPRYTFQGAERRDYSNGLVLVNPSGTKTAVVTLPRKCADLYGKMLSKVTLEPASGIVLLSGK